MLGIISSFVLSVFLSGASYVFNEPDAYIVNDSPYTIYYKPESSKANPGLDQDAAYPVAPGERLLAPVDAIVTPLTTSGKVYRVPTGGKVMIDQYGVAKPSGVLSKLFVLFPSYGTAQPPCDGFAMLANSKHVLLLMPDVVVAAN